MLAAIPRASPEARLINAAVRTFTLVVAPTAVLMGVVPHLYEELGALGPTLVATGFVLLWVVEHRGRHVVDVAASLVVLTLALHSLLDGASLAVALRVGSGPASTLLALALAVHRLPEGLFIGHTVLPRMGRRRTGAIVVLLSAATVAGSMLGREALAQVGGKIASGAVAIGVGVVLRALLHRHSSVPPFAPKGAGKQPGPVAPDRSRSL